MKNSIEVLTSSEIKDVSGGGLVKDTLKLISAVVFPCLGFAIAIGFYLCITKPANEGRHEL